MQSSRDILSASHLRMSRVDLYSPLEPKLGQRWDIEPPKLDLDITLDIWL
jgi:hypothetical protein